MTDAEQLVGESVDEDGPTTEDRLAAAEANGWVAVKTPYVVDPSGAMGDNEAHADFRNKSMPPWRMVKYVGGKEIDRCGDSLEHLLDVVEGFDADQARLKPEFRLGA